MKSIYVRNRGEHDELISFNESSIQKLKEYGQSLIDEAVMGKLEM